MTDNPSDNYGNEYYVTKWAGVVENRKDPGLTGRVQVRIVGIHPEDTYSLPTEKLPWALTELSAGSAHLFNGPREGDWVTGYFINGDTQYPVVTGVTNGIRSVPFRTPNPNANVIINAVNKKYNSDTAELSRLSRQFNLLSIQPSGKNLVEIAKLSFQINLKQLSISNLSQLKTDLNTTYNTRVQYGYRDNRSIAEVNAGAKVPTRWDKYKAPDYQAGQPTIPQYARGIVIGSANEYSVRNRAHVCDIAMQVRYQLGKAHFAMELTKTIREGIKTFLQGLGTSPFASWLAGEARKVAGYIKKITKYLKDANRFIKDVVIQLNLMKAMFEFLKNLPAYLKKLFDRCLKEIFREIATFVFDLVSDVFPTDEPSVSGVLQAVGDVITSTSDLINEANKTKVLAEQLVYTLNTDNPSPYTAQQTEQIFAEQFPEIYDNVKQKVLSPIL